MFKSSRTSDDLRDDENFTLLERDAIFEGKLTFDGTVQIYGQFKGDIFSSGTLVIGETANVEGNIEVGTLRIAGRVKAHIVVKDRLELLAQAQVLGDISTPSLVVEHGAKFQGQCQMGVSGESTEGRAPYVPARALESRELGSGRSVNPLDEIELFQ